MDKTLAIHNLYYRANSITDERRRLGATLDNYDYLSGLARNFDAIAKCADRLGSEFANDRVAPMLATTIHKAMIALIPSYGLGNFDWSGAGEDLSYLVHMAWVILRQCEEVGMAQAICDKHNLFTTMCELQERLDEQALTDLAND
jgi:hypothetical protein